MLKIIPMSFNLTGCLMSVDQWTSRTNEETSISHFTIVIEIK